MEVRRLVKQHCDLHTPIAISRLPQFPSSGSIVQMLSLLPLLLASSAPGPNKDQPSPTARAADRCEMPDGWAAATKHRPRYILFGEVHGTQEAPAFFGGVACALALRGERILVAIEQDASRNAAWQDAWKLPVGSFAPAILSKGWVGRRDGVASEAMFAMLVRLHALKERGLPIDIVAFNGARDKDQASRFAHLPAQGPHEAAQAENIYTAAQARHYDRVLVLVGNLHALKRAYGEGVDRFYPMAKRLSRLGRTASFSMRWAAGSMWNCIPRAGTDIPVGQPVPNDAIDCANHIDKGDPDLQRRPFMHLGPFPGTKPSSYYDGYFWLGPVHGSPPKVP